MTWLYVPGISCHSATDTQAPSSHSDPWHGYEPYVVLSGTPTQRPSSWRGWKNRGWIKHLSGMTCAPSTAQRGVDEWISSLPVSPANPSPQPDCAVELTMSGGSGPQSSGSSLMFDPAASSWRTSLSLFDMDYPKSSTALPRTGSMRNGVCTPRPPLVPRTSVNGSGSWPTPNAADSERTSETMVRGNPTLLGAGRHWPTPRTVDAKGDVYQIDPSGRRWESLTGMGRQVMWGTPVARDVQGSVESHMAQKAKIKDGANRTAVTSLTVQAKLWPTPRASMNENRTTKHAPSHGVTHGRTLAGEASHQTPTTETDGNDGSPRADLNPSFVASLMGLPWDWLTIDQKCEACE